MLRVSVALSLLCLVSASKLSTDDDRIVNGNKASINEHAYQCSLQKNGMHFCGGSILNEKQILTAAHCFKNLTSAHIPLLSVRCGTIQWNTGGVLRNVESFETHEDYDSKTFKNDVAIVTMATQIFYNNKMQPAELATKTPIDGTPCRVSGWGRLEESNKNKPIWMQTTDVLSLTKKTCASQKYLYGSTIKDTMICANADGHDACQGDSGGPLVSYRDNTLVGIVSWGYGCAKEGLPGVYSNVAELRPWIIAHSMK